MLLGGKKTKWIVRARMLSFIVPNKLFKVFELNPFERSDVLINKKKDQLVGNAIDNASRIHPKVYIYIYSYCRPVKGLKNDYTTIVFQRSMITVARFSPLLHSPCYHSVHGIGIFFFIAWWNDN